MQAWHDILRKLIKKIRYFDRILMIISKLFIAREHTWIQKFDHRTERTNILSSQLKLLFESSQLDYVIEV